jgi:hypothetical protein
MFWRLSAAIVALYLVHASQNGTGDAARLAADVQREAPKAMVAACLDRPDLCRQVLQHATGLGATETTSGTARRAPIEADHKAPPLPVNAGEFPLPPVRPATLITRKGT